jgi:two-component sensor histidine kinase
LHDTNPGHRAASDWNSSAIGDVTAGDLERLDFALRAGRLGYWEFHPQTRQLISSGTYRENWGRVATEEFTYEQLLASIHPDERAAHELSVQKAVEEGGELDAEYRVAWPDGSTHWLRMKGRTVPDSHGSGMRLAGTSADITDQKKVEEALREETHTLETLNRIAAVISADLDLGRIVQAVTDAATDVSGAKFGAFFYNVLDESGESYTLYSLSGAPREAFEKFGQPRNTPVFEPTFRGIGIVRSDDITKDPRYGTMAPHHGMPKGHLPVRSYLAVPVISRTGKVLGGLFFGHDKTGVFNERVERTVSAIASQAALAIDNAQLFRHAQNEISQRRRGEDLQKLLLAELDHRVKNTLAIVQSIATQTLRHARTSKEFRAGFEARLIALSNAHSLLTQSNWEGLTLEEVVDLIMRPYQGEDGPRYRIEGLTNFRIGPQSAIALAMAFHELATNAAKYGALHRPKGRVAIHFRKIEESPPRLAVRWEEKGGPKVKPSTRTGFGTRLLRTLPDIRYEFHPEGVECSFTTILGGAE